MRGGIDEHKSIIPIDRNGILIDGSHRVAVAAYFDLEIPVVILPIETTPMDVNFFKMRLVPPSDIDFMCRELIDWCDNLYLCCLWPSAESAEKREKAIGLIEEKGRIICRKYISITDSGLYNLIPQIYRTKDWVGSVNDRFLSATPKVNLCKGNGGLDVILFRYEGLVLHCVIGGE